MARSADSNYDTIRPQYETRIDGNYYLPQFLGGDHSLKFGYRYRTTPIESISQYGGGGEVRIRSASNMNTCTVGGVTYTLGCHEANITRDADFKIQRWDSDFFINDNYRFRRLSVNVGLRLDHYDDEAVAASIPANRVLPDLLPAIEFPGADSGVVWNNWQPRLGANYDLFGTGKTVVKFSASRYYGITNGTSNVLQAASATTLRYAWRDLNGDLIAQRNELDLSRFLTTPSSNYNQANPSSVIVPVTVDPNLENAGTQEFTAGVDHELMRGFAVGATYIHRKYDQFANTFRVGVSSDEYSPVSFTAACGNIVNGTPTCDQASYTGTYFVRGAPLPAAQFRRNTGQYETYDGVELTARKRFSQRWMMSASYAVSTGTHYDPEPTRDYTDPTNIAVENGKRTSVAPWFGQNLGAVRATVGYVPLGTPRRALRLHVQHDDSFADPSQQSRYGLGQAPGQQQPASSEFFAAGHAPRQDRETGDASNHAGGDGLQRVQQQRRALDHYASEHVDGE